jgi:hypothetical protein
MPVTPRPFRAIPYGIAFSLHQVGPLQSVTGMYNIGGCRGSNALPTALDVDAVAVAVKTWVQDVVNGPLPLVSNNSTFESVRAWSLAEQGGPELTLAIGLPGAAGFNPVAALAVELMLEAQVHARARNGRWFAGIPDNANIGLDGLWKANYAMAWATSLTFLGNSLNTAGYIWSVASMKFGLMRPILACVGNRVVSFQTRRNFGRD